MLKEGAIWVMLILIKLLVLILILMEHAQRVNGLVLLKHSKSMCLNPYFNGTCSKRVYQNYGK